MAAEDVASLFGITLIVGLATLVAATIRPSWRSAVAAHALPLAAAIAVGATAGSLYFSEVADFIPCELCWFQRIAMYPIAAIALIALIRRDRAARWYFVPIAAIGTAISTYHYLIEWGVLDDSENCALFGPSCAAVWYREFGFVTMAFGALAGFVAIIVLNTVSFDSVSNPQENT